LLTFQSRADHRIAAILTRFWGKMFAGTFDDDRNSTCVLQQVT